MIKTNHSFKACLITAKSLLLLLLSMGVSAPLFAQKEKKIPSRFKKGFIVKHSGDTLFGHVNYNDILYIRFMDQNGKKKTYTAAKIRGFGDLDQNRFMESHFLTNKDASYFFERVVSGKYPLLFCFDQASSQSAATAASGLLLGAMDHLISSKYTSPFYFTKEGKLHVLPAHADPFRDTMLTHFADFDYIRAIKDTPEFIFKNVVSIFQYINPK